MRYLLILLCATLMACSTAPHKVEDGSAAQGSAEQQNRQFETMGVPHQLPRDTLRGF